MLVFIVYAADNIGFHRVESEADGSVGYLPGFMLGEYFDDSE